MTKYDEILYKYFENEDEGFLHFPLKYYKVLSEESQKFVEMALKRNDEEKLFEIGQSLIEGRLDFPIDVKIGLNFVKETMNRGNKVSLVYYIGILIKGDLIPSNHKQARKLLETQFSKDKSTYTKLQGKLLKNEKRYVESSEYLKISIELGNDESLYEYAELHRKSHIQGETQDKFNEMHTAI